MCITSLDSKIGRSCPRPRSASNSSRAAFLTVVQLWMCRLRLPTANIDSRKGAARSGSTLQRFFSLSCQDKQEAEVIMSILPKGEHSSPTIGAAGGDTALRKNALGLPEVLFQSITAMAPAAAVATALSPAVLLAGASLPLAVLMATIACAFIASCIGQLAIHIPSAGGMYTYISRSLGGKLGFLSAWVFILAQPLLLPLVAL